MATLTITNQLKVPDTIERDRQREREKVIQKKVKKSSKK